MLYEYHCQKCDKIYERIFKVTNFPNTVKCELCGGRARKILSRSTIQTDNDVTWLPSASKALTRHHEPPITTRTEYKRYLRNNNLEPKC